MLGSLMLFEGSGPDMKLSWSVLLPTLLLVSGFFVVVAALVFRVQVSKPTTGNRGLIGEIGIVKKACAPEGKVFVHGELWNAVARQPIAEDIKVQVLKVDRLVLEVEPVPEQTKDS
jgi:membrane-bound serine protease (ClpP class)